MPAEAVIINTPVPDFTLPSFVAIEIAIGTEDDMQFPNIE